MKRCVIQRDILESNWWMWVGYRTAWIEQRRSAPPTTLLYNTSKGTKFYVRPSVQCSNALFKTTIIKMHNAWIQKHKSIRIHCQLLRNCIYICFFWQWNYYLNMSYKYINCINVWKCIGNWKHNFLYSYMADHLCVDCKKHCFTNGSDLNWVIPCKVYDSSSCCILNIQRKLGS